MNLSQDETNNKENEAECRLLTAASLNGIAVGSGPGAVSGCLVGLDGRGCCLFTLNFFTWLIFFLGLIKIISLINLR